MYWPEFNLTRIRPGAGQKAKAKQLPVLPGSLMFFAYDPKTKEKLPEYDLFPLSMCFGLKEDGFYGYNLHFLDMGTRMYITKLVNRSTTISDKPYVQYRLANAALESLYDKDPFKGVVKRYLYSHVRSPIITIHPDDWELIIGLPLDKIVKGKRK